MRLAGLAVAALLAGCQSLGLPTRVDVPIAVSCLPAAMPARPDIFTDAQLLAMDDFHLVIALQQNAARLADYLSELEAILVACR